jgi:hypothetical protein
VGYAALAGQIERARAAAATGVGERVRFEVYSIRA